MQEAASLNHDSIPEMRQPSSTSQIWNNISHILYPINCGEFDTQATARSIEKQHTTPVVIQSPKLLLDPVHAHPSFSAAQ